MAELPPGVVKIDEGSCPPGTLCVWRDVNRKGPGYGIGAGYNVDLSQLPIEGGVGGTNTMAKNASSWHNRTESTAKLIGIDTRELNPDDSIEEDAQHNDTVEEVEWKL